jgi:hypothetical protein
MTFPLPKGWVLVFDFKRGKVYTAKQFDNASDLQRWLDS